MAAQSPDFDICSAMVRGDQTVRAVASEEAYRRRLDCSPHLPMIQAQQQNDAARAALSLQMMQATKPQPYQLPMPAPVQPARSVNCTSQRIGNQVTTNCY
jgi:hypothetical protein